MLFIDHDIADFESQRQMGIFTTKSNINLNKRKPDPCFSGSESNIANKVRF